MAETHAKPEKPKRKKATLSQKEQSERFIETARTIGADETGKAFDEKFLSVVKKPDERDS